MPNKRSESEKKPDGRWNLSACLRKVLRDLGADAPTDAVSKEFKKRYDVDELPANLYVIRAEIRKEQGGEKVKAQAVETPTHKPRTVTTAAKEAVATNGHAPSSNVVRAVQLTQEAMELCGGREGLLALIDRLTEPAVVVE